MTYPPTNPGYPAPQQPGFGAPAAPPRPAGPSRLPSYLTAAVAALGLAAYLASFGPLLTINTDIGPFGGAEFTASGLSYWTVAALVGALLAAVSLIGRRRVPPGGQAATTAGSYTAVIAVSAVLGVLLVIAQIINRPEGFSVGWALWLVLLFTLLQAAAAVVALLFETGAITAPSPRPRYEPYGPYGPPPGYYPGVPAPGQPGQQPGYPTPYGGYPSAGAAGDASDTPPTGFPSYSPGASATQQPSGQHAAADEASAPGAGSTPDSTKP